MPAKFVHSVSLTAELTALIDEKIATGHYRSASEVVRAPLRLLQHRTQKWICTFGTNPMLSP
ncbi:type II toxin-antitoxin system ParD family antitoxin [Microvirga sp. KLBC 81]|uniref:type II toxin-antitoxin system ParD family antitoxin n=1 Tax=Microvirga sp. KLBC 81 TaxID=1862707 RepID=UPI000D50C873|nr:type II toxin-antitoxin system ParD family antitoxin [Microvirga sp. KLBC 81]PVE21566.1 type II toxin-antitoxin system ParD family antitoxin [Microvirga sp. KLBC 81]